MLMVLMGYTFDIYLLKIVCIKNNYSYSNNNVTSVLLSNNVIYLIVLKIWYLKLGC